MSRLLLSAWLLASLCCFHHVSAVDHTEKIAVIDIGTGVGGLPSGWNSDPDTCKWTGISCENDHIYMIAWPSMGLTGTLANNFYNLPYLRTFDVSSNQLTRFIPDSFGFLRSLHEVSLAFNDLSGEIPPSMSYLTNITTFQLQGNRISGTIPSNWASWRSLETFSMAENRLEGSVPDMFGNMRSLLEVSLGNNSLSGSIPPSLYEATTLQVLNLEGNRMSGSLSSRVSQWSFLTSLQLSNNEFQGTLPSEIGAMVKLRELDLRRNQFTGEMPDVFANSLSIGGNEIHLCNNELMRLEDFTFGDLPVCDVSGLSSCGCSKLWAGCTGPSHCSDASCAGDKPLPSFYCGEDGWRSDVSVEVPSGQNITLSGPTFIKGMLSMDSLSTLKFYGLLPTLHLTGCADVIYAEVEITEQDLKIIIASSSSTYIDTLMIAPCGVATVEVTSKIALGCKQARSSIVTDLDPNGIFSMAVEYTGFYSACATWTIPLMGTIHAIIVSAGIAYLIFTYCRPGYN